MLVLISSLNVYIVLNAACSESWGHSRTAFANISMSNCFPSFIVRWILNFVDQSTNENHENWYPAKKKGISQYLVLKSVGSQTYYIYFVKTYAQMLKLLPIAISKPRVGFHIIHCKCQKEKCISQKCTIYTLWSTNLYYVDYNPLISSGQYLRCIHDEKIKFSELPVIH